MRRDEKKNDNAIIYKKSNTLINSKGRSSAMGLKLFAVGILKARQSASGAITAQISGQELRRLFNRTSGSFYSEIRELIKPSDESKPSLLDWRIYIEDPAKEKVIGINVISEATFEGGELSITFNPGIKNHIYGLKGDYGSLSLSTTLSLKSSYAIRFYEIFKAYMDKQAAITKDTTGPYVLTYTISDLKEILGLIKVTRTKDGPVRQELLSNYSNFKTRVLDRACSEINEQSNIHADYEPIRSGRGGKATGVRFILTRQAQKPKQTEALTDDKLAVLNDASVLLKDTSLNLLDIKAICDAAEYDMSKIERAYKLSKKAKSIESLTGWMIAAIRDGYEDMPKQGKSRKDSFNAFEQNKYDFDEIERRLLEQ